MLFLDEPTTGLDPRNRNEVWAAIRELVAGGTTVLLTTQYLDEADQLADQIVVIEAGRVIAEGTPDELKARVGGDRLEVVVHRGRRPGRGRARGRRVGRRRARGRPRGPPGQRAGRPPGHGAGRGARGAGDAGVAVADIGLRRPTLDDVFLRLTGHQGRAPTTRPTEAGPTPVTRAATAPRPRPTEEAA